MCVAVCSLALTCRERVAKPCTDRYTDLIPSQQAAPPAVGISDAAHPSNDPLYRPFRSFLSSLVVVASLLRGRGGCNMQKFRPCQT